MKQATLKIYSPIDSYGWQLWRVRSFLAEHAKDEVTIEVNSLGGSVNDAMMISKEIADHGNVTVRLLAFCASAVTWMGFGAKRVEIADDAMWLCHQSSVLVDIYSSLNADDIEKTIEDLQKSKKLAEATDLIIARKYLDKATANGKDTTLAKVIDLMKEEKYLTAQEVLALGFVDGIITNAKSMTNEVRQFVVENHAALKMPAVPEETTVQEEEGLMARVRNMVSELLGGKKDPEAPAAEENDNKVEITQPQNQPTMKKEFKLVLQLLGMAAFTVNEQGALLTEEQLQKIEDQLQQAKQEHDDAAAAVAALDAISDNVKSIDGLKNKVMAVKTVLDRTPLVAPDSQTPLSKTEDEKKAEKLKECAVDEINNEAKNL
jgi:ATP-dependent protease ClpP protease subunit